MCGDMVMAESNTTSKFLIVADGDISVVPMQRRYIRWGGEAIKNSVFESLSLSLPTNCFNVINFISLKHQRKIFSVIFLEYLRLASLVYKHFFFIVTSVFFQGTRHRQCDFLLS